MKCFNFVLIFVLFITINITTAYRVIDVNGTDTILAFENENIKIECKTDQQMTYCGFIDPSRKRYSFADTSLSNGRCEVKIKATKGDSGEWTCHIGRKELRVEIQKKILVRVVNQVAAILPNITVTHGKSVTLACATTKGLMPMSYCRFEPPKGSPFNIDSSVTASNAILNKYYFPPNKSLDRGDCAVTIRKVKYEDVGLWTCGAGLDDGKEHTDVIKLEVEGLYTMSTASATGVAFGGILIVVALGLLGFVAWRKRRYLGSAPQQPEVIEIQDLGQQPVERSPTPQRMIPIVSVQSPSEPGTSPLMSRSS